MIFNKLVIYTRNIFRLGKSEVFFVTLSNANQDMTMIVFVTLKSIQCKYFDDAADVWETKGCSVANSTSDTTVCRCNRVAQFGLSEMDIAAELSFQRVPVIPVLILTSCGAKAQQTPSPWCASRHRAVSRK